MSAARTRRLLSALVMTALLLPLLQQLFHPVPVGPLGGRAAQPVPPPELTLAAWFDGRLQGQAAVWANVSFGFRSWLVRLNDELAFRLFGRVKADSLLVGRDGYLYATASVDAFEGRDFAGEEVLAARLGSLVRLQAALQARGRTLLVVLVPGKARTLPQHLPPARSRPGLRTNRAWLTARAPQAGLNLLDLEPRFQQWSREAPWPLYGPHGFHWTVYAAHLAGDAVAREIERLRGERLPRMWIERLELSDRPRSSDADALAGMNLLFRWPSPLLAYPRARYEDTGATRPDVLAVADSFWWLFVNEGIARGLFGRTQLWFYYDELHTPDAPVVRREDVDLARVLERQDVVVLMANDSTLARLGWGFVEDAEDLLTLGRVRPRTRLAPVPEG